jgi:predicted membrane channel-forming protein YqfA (hemolysin III family)
MLMTGNELSTYVAIVISLVCSYIPGVKDAYDKLDATCKRLVMLILLAASTGIIFALSCWGAVKDYIPVECSTGGALSLLRAFIQAVIANQATFLISPKLNLLPKLANPPIR